ncbi:MAG TPA: hypothetical protein VFC85_06825, partial [Verrucomicrobiae bacterium]|nr:hypothetical protein [Verrucomicrobiae bacterium]
PNALPKIGALELGKLAVETDGGKSEKNSSPQHSKSETRKSAKKNSAEIAPLVVDANAIPILQPEINAETIVATAGSKSVSIQMPEPVAKAANQESELNTKEADKSPEKTHLEISSAPLNANLILSPEINVLAANSQKLSVQTSGLKVDFKKSEALTPTIAAKEKIESNAKIAADVSSISAKIPVLGKLPQAFDVLPELTKISTTNAKVASPIVPQKLPDVETKSVPPNPATKIDPAIKTDGQGKITPSVEISAIAKTDVTDSKISAPTSANPQVTPLTNNTGDSATQKTVVASVENFSAPKISTSPDLTAKVATSAVSQVDGTAVAKQDVPMNKTEIPNKIASVAGKILPGEVVSAGQKNSLPVRGNFFESVSPRAEQMTANVAADSSVSDRAASPESADVISSAVVADQRLQVLERMQDLVALNALRLGNSSANSLQVVVKPDAGTQLSLELRQRGDGVEALAVLQRGDFEHLNQQWPGLQQQLESRRIRLAPLVNDGNLVNSDGNNFQHKQNQSAKSNLFSTEMFMESAPAVPVIAPFGKSVASANQGWETWA